jgi:hypothetical protein
MKTKWSTTGSIAYTASYMKLGRSTDLSEVMKKLIGICETQAAHQA